MKISDINNLKPGDNFLYNGEVAEILTVQPKEPDEIIQIDGKPVTIQDKNVGIFFKVKDKFVFLRSRLDSKMIFEGRVYELDLSNYTVII